MKSCKQLLDEFHLIGSHLPPHICQRIVDGQAVYENECGDHLPEVQTAVALWKEIQTRLKFMPPYSTLVQ